MSTMPPSLFLGADSSSESSGPATPAPNSASLPSSSPLAPTSWSGPTTPSSPVEASASPMPAVSNSIVEEALRDLQSSPLWIGNSTSLLQNCEWCVSSTGNSSILKWKHDAPARPADSDDDVLVGWIGQVSMDGSVLRADGGWKVGGT